MDIQTTDRHEDTQTDKQTYRETDNCLNQEKNYQNIPTILSYDMIVVKIVHIKQIFFSSQQMRPGTLSFFRSKEMPQNTHYTLG